MTITHSLEDLKNFHNNAIQFFGAEIMLLDQVLTKIDDERLIKCSPLLISSGQTGAAIIQLAQQADMFSSETVMLARAFMEKMTNFCYAAICDDNEFRAFLLHPIYKNYHNTSNSKMGDNTDLESIKVNNILRIEKQEKLKEKDSVKEALALFSETKSNLNWTKKTFQQRIDVIKEWGKILDVFFALNKFEYYSDASEILHGSLYGCIYNMGILNSDYEFGSEEYDKALLKDNTCMLIHLGTLIHESFTVINYKDDIGEIWDHSYHNRGQALNLMYHVLGKTFKRDTP